ncbi:hypothetical protein BJ508DRAFT_373746 [Ascobolus immersus RN42]|uniref:Uncharacterized protein n=1 Tax=Ascobolus immersus RN42 TaxID=1160509 RepID=A0A3N4IMF5_ASCIM|nr:hypothetical protein BJ508DRAFT_373746 [Ascobolus immersus RN42]
MANRDFYGTFALEEEAERSERSIDPNLLHNKQNDRPQSKNASYTQEACAYNPSSHQYEGLDSADGISLTEKDPNNTPVGEGEFFLVNYQEDFDRSFHPSKLLNYSDWARNMSSPAPTLASLSDEAEEQTSQEPESLDPRLLAPFIDTYTTIPKSIWNEIHEVYATPEYIDPAELFLPPPSNGIIHHVVDLTAEGEEPHIDHRLAASTGRFGKNNKSYATRTRTLITPEPHREETSSHSPSPIRRRGGTRIPKAVGSVSSPPPDHATIWDEVLSEPLTQSHHLGSRAGVATLLLLHCIKHPVHYWPHGISRNGLLDIASQLFPETARKYDEKHDNKRFWRSISDMIGGWKKGGEGRNPTPYLRVAGKGGPRNITMYVLTEKGVAKAWSVMESEELDEIIAARIKMVDDWKAAQGGPRIASKAPRHQSRAQKKVLIQEHEKDELDNAVFDHNNEEFVDNDDETVVAPDEEVQVDWDNAEWNESRTAKKQRLTRNSTLVGPGFDIFEDGRKVHKFASSKEKMGLKMEMAKDERLNRVNTQAMKRAHTVAGGGLGMRGRGGNKHVGVSTSRKRKFLIED